MSQAINERDLNTPQLNKFLQANVWVARIVHTENDLQIFNVACQCF